MTVQEIREFVTGELSSYDLSTKEVEKYVNNIKNLERLIERRNFDKNPLELFIQNLEESIEFFKSQGFDDEKALAYAKITVIDSSRKDYQLRLCLLRVLNLTESIMSEGSYTNRFNIKDVHAKKMYLLSNNIEVKSAAELLIHNSNIKFEKKFPINVNDLLIKYPVTKELEDIWKFIGTMDNDTFQNYFNMTREELSYIYPTTKEEIAALHYIASMTDEELSTKYGMERKQLLQKYPINSDTLRAIQSIHKASSQTVLKAMGMPKQEVLHLRTITTEMIQLANRQMKLQRRGTYSKEELREKLKSMKKGTI